MTERVEYFRVKERVDEFMSGGPFNEGIGSYETAIEVHAEFGVLYSPQEIHAIWTQGKPWTEDYDRWECCGNVVQMGHGELCLEPRKE